MEPNSALRFEHPRAVACLCTLDLSVAPSQDGQSASAPTGTFGLQIRSDPAPTLGARRPDNPQGWYRKAATASWTGRTRADARGWTGSVWRPVPTGGDRLALLGQPVRQGDEPLAARERRLRQLHIGGGANPCRDKAASRSWACWSGPAGDPPAGRALRAPTGAPATSLSFILCCPSRDPWLRCATGGLNCCFMVSDTMR